MEPDIKGTPDIKDRYVSEGRNPYSDGTISTRSIVGIQVFLISVCDIEEARNTGSFLLRSRGRYRRLHPANHQTKRDSHISDFYTAGAGGRFSVSHWRDITRPFREATASACAEAGEKAAGRSPPPPGAARGTTAGE